MSLTGAVRNPDVRKRIRATYTKPKFGREQSLLAPPLTKRYALVGTAFDYLLRFTIQRENHKAIVSTWIAEKGCDKLSQYFVTDCDTDETELRPSGARKVGERIINQARASHREYLETGLITDTLLEAVVGLAKLDNVYRCGFVDEHLDDVDPKDLQDLRNLITVVPDRVLKARLRCVLNPTFNEGSTIVRGADADILMDDTLIEVKTTKSAYFRPEDFDQLIGYLALAQAWGITGLVKKPRIRNLGIYFARYGDYRVFPINDVLDQRAFRKFVDWFKSMLEGRYARRQQKLQEARARKQRLGDHPRRKKAVAKRRGKKKAVRRRSK